MKTSVFNYSYNLVLVYCQSIVSTNHFQLNSITRYQSGMIRVPQFLIDLSALGFQLLKIKIHQIFMHIKKSIRMSRQNLVLLHLS
jgi:hypothetical protein